MTIRSRIQQRVEAELDRLRVEERSILQRIRIIGYGNERVTWMFCQGDALARLLRFCCLHRYCAGSTILQFHY